MKVANETQHTLIEQLEAKLNESQDLNEQYREQLDEEEKQRKEMER